MIPSPRPFHLLLKEIEKASFLEFSRIPMRSIDGLSCDCSGLITILLKEQNLFPKGLEKTPKVKDYYQWVVKEELQKTTIQELDRYDVLLWKKTTPPKSGDTGHMLLLLKRPKKLSNCSYELSILEVNRFSGLSKRKVEVTTFNDGRLKGIAWHPEKTKVKETTIIGASLFKKPSCKECQNIIDLCQCDQMPNPKPKAPPIIVFRHPSEVGHSLGTVKILQQYFSDLTVEEGEVFTKRRATLLYPQKESKEDQTNLVPDKISSENPLILIDGTWKKAFKIIQKNPWLLELPRLSLEGHESHYFLRKQKGAHHLSSLESFCYGWLQFSKEGSDALLHSKVILDIFHDFIEKRKVFYGDEVIEEYFKERS